MNFPGRVLPPPSVADPESTESEAADADDDERDIEPTPQSEALRRQQRVIGVGIALLAGVAVTVSTLQQLPSVPVVAAVVGGALTTAVFFRMLSTGIFSGTEE